MKDVICFCLKIRMAIHLLAEKGLRGTENPCSGDITLEVGLRGWVISSELLLYRQYHNGAV